MLKRFAKEDTLGYQQDDMNRIEYVLRKLEDDTFMNAPYGYISITPEGIIKKVNHLILNWTGYNDEEILNKRIDQFLIKEYADAPFEITDSYNEPYKLVSKNAIPISVLLDVIKLKESKDNALVMRITQEANHVNKTSTDKTPSTQGHLQMHKMNYVSSSVTHEIQTPLSIIKGTIDLLDDTTLTHQQKEYLDILKNSSEVLRNVMMDVIDFNGLNDNSFLKHNAINIRNFIHGIFRMHSVIALRKNVDLKLIIDDKMPETVYGDKTKLAQVLLNLLSNAIKFTEQGAVILEVQQQHLSDKDVTLLFTVTDTGIGIEENEINVIFNEFTQANDKIQREYGGLGLGLSICKKILSLYGSVIKVRSSPLGSKFSFSLTLPLGNNSNADNVNLRENKLKKDVTILIADDNQANAIITSHYLTKLNIQYEIVPDGEIAYQKVLEGRFDLILMDLQMPVASGINATKKIRSITNEHIKNIPIIAFSADNILTKTQLREIGINDFLLKPFDIEDLIKVITSNLPEFKINDHTVIEFDQTINLDSLNKLTGGNAEELSILVKKSIEEFEEGKVAFAKAFDANDIVKIRAIAHKLKSQIHYLKATKLQSVITKALEILTSVDTSAESPSLILNEILIEIERIIALMKRI
jgi:signal transduction histidine kinase/FixJ family two-component response regulator